jgi:hypothetical protein
MSAQEPMASAISSFLRLARGIWALLTVYNSGTRVLADAEATIGLSPSCRSHVRASASNPRQS